MYLSFYAFIGFALMLHALYKMLTLLYHRQRYASIQGCKPPQSHHHTDPIFGSDEIRAMISAANSKTYLDRVRQIYTAHGNTYSCNLAFSTTIHTNEPENIMAILTSQFRDFAMPSARRKAWYPLLGNSIILTDGAQWEHSRALLRPSFTRSQVSDVRGYEKHISNLQKALPPSGETVDLGELFFRLTADTTTEMLFGKSIESLVHPEAFGNQFLKAFHEAQIGGVKRWRLGKLANFVPNKKFWESLEMVNKFMEEHVEAAMQFRGGLLDDEGKDNKKREVDSEPARYIFSRELAKLTDDRKTIRDELLTIFFAGRDTTAGLLTNLFFFLARRSDIWSRIRDEVATLNGETPTFEQLGSLTYTRNCINECE